MSYLNRPSTGKFTFDGPMSDARRGSAGTLVYSWILAVACLGKGIGSFRGPIYDVKASVHCKSSRNLPES